MEEVKRKSDRRVVRTKRAIRTAFIKLLAQKDFNQISVKDIADTADVDRKTVYNYYGGVYEIRSEVENELTELFEQAVKELDFEKNIKNPLHIFEILTEIINSNIELYGCLMQVNANSHIMRKINLMLRNKVCDALRQADLVGCDVELCANFVTSGMLTIYQQWFSTGRVMPLEELSRQAGMLVIHGLHSFSTGDRGE